MHSTGIFGQYMLVFIGGGLGSMLRFSIGMLLPAQRFPWATLAANVFACIILGMLSAWYGQGRLSNQQRLLLATGMCGGFSTFSTFSNETWGLWQNGNIWWAFANIALNLVLCFSGLVFGMKIVA